MFEGVYVAIITPFLADGGVDHKGLAKLSDELIERGVHGLVPVGTTGEPATLSHQEHIDVIKTVVDAANKRVPILAGAGSNATSEAIELTLAAKAAGAAGTLQITPYYIKPTQEGLYRHFEAIAKATALPMLIYNIPGRTAVSLQPDTIGRLARLPEVVGLKEATGDITQTTEALLRVPPSFTVTAGDDAMTLPMLALGGKGVISVAAQVAPENMLAMYNAWLNGDLAGARKHHEALYPLIKSLFLETNPAPVKAALHMLGKIERADLRLPLAPIGHNTRAAIRDALAQLGLGDGARGR